MTRAEYLRYARQPKKVPDLTPPARCVGLIQYFNSLRGFAGVVDNPLNMTVINDWQQHVGISLEKWERDCLFAMDRALRRTFPEVLKYHSERKQVKTGGK